MKLSYLLLYILYIWSKINLSLVNLGHEIKFKHKMLLENILRNRIKTYIDDNKLRIVLKMFIIVRF